MKKVCSKCKINKPLKDYYKNAGHKDGRQSKCKSCSNAYFKSDKGKLAQVKYNKSDKGKSLIAKRKKAWIPILEKIYGTIACSKCGYAKCFAALEFHHRQSEVKKFSISYILDCKVTKERIKEIKKCDLLCANCHREHHNGC
jgi:hypothetical protein